MTDHLCTSSTAALQKAAMSDMNLPKRSYLYRAYNGMAEKPLLSIAFVAVDNYIEIWNSPTYVCKIQFFPWPNTT